MQKKIFKCLILACIYNFICEPEQNPRSCRARVAPLGPATGYWPGILDAYDILSIAYLIVYFGMPFTRVPWTKILKICHVLSIHHVHIYVRAAERSYANHHMTSTHNERFWHSKFEELLINTMKLAVAFRQNYGFRACEMYTCAKFTPANDLFCTWASTLQADIIRKSTKRFGIQPSL